MGFREGETWTGFVTAPVLLRNDEIAWKYTGADGVPRALKILLSTSSNGWNAATTPGLSSD